MLECYFQNYQYFAENNLIFLKRAEESLENIKITIDGKKGDCLIIYIESLNTIEAVHSIIGKEFVVESESIRSLDVEGEGHFVFDLLNLKVIDYKTKEEYGTINDVVDFGGGPLLEIQLNKQNTKNKDKKETVEYFEKNKNTVKDVDLLQGIISIVVD